MVVAIPLHDRLEPLSCRCRWGMSASAELLMDRFQLRPQALLRRLAADREGARLAVPLTAGRAAQQVERLQVPFGPLLPVRHGMWPTRDQARFLRMQCQPERLQAASQRRQEPLCVPSELEAVHNIIGTADDHHLPLGGCVAPGVHPPIDDIMEVDLRQPRAHYTSYQVAKNVVEFATSLPRAPLRPGSGAGCVGAPLTLVKPDDIPAERERGGRHGPSRTATAQDAGGERQVCTAPAQPPLGGAGLCTGGADHASPPQAPRPPGRLNVR
jgi:hypothetical protein